MLRSITVAAVRMGVLLALASAACGAQGETTATDSPSADTSTPATPATPASDGPTDGLDLIALPDSSGALPADVEIGCPSGPSFPASALEEVRPLAGSGLDEVEVEVRTFLESEEGQFWPQEGWLILHETENLVLVVNAGGDPDAAESGISFMTIERSASGWRWAGASSGGSCPLVTSVPDDLNTVEWRIDPNGPPLGPDTTRIELLVTERECASGQAMGDRLLGPEIVTTDSAVYLAFAAEPPPGDAHDCQGNPDQAVVVELREPLGDRPVLDGMAVAGDLGEHLERLAG